MIDNTVRVLTNYSIWQVQDVLTEYAKAGYKLVSTHMGTRGCNTVTELYLFFVKEK